MSGADGRLLASLAECLDGLHFPARTGAIASHARKAGAEQEILQRIEAQGDRSFESLAALGKALGVAEDDETTRKRSGTLETRSRVDEASAESFPASDPPSHTATTTSGGPRS